ncbi:Putative peptidoglycan binding domain-containing protein [Streptomyces sp. cf386]|uniref:glycoside hydrolase domain-containing protein n=1 Tax=Streptomyces sp. cf386 TaxID=1761904 RepID=UPI000890FFEE|nr:glycoside hydrolase domain-containing protein [Streptomyces sp. cf386]SDN01655.1 Putative peptidoglycan binding domain-containing protein [Streptomyces sp. cf386]
MDDPNVLAAQKWVNETYDGVADRYERCPQDGSTGWATVLSLTQGLQHELGISPTVRNFGPGTFDALVARGGIRPSETKTNLIRIINYALWCKGYYGASSAGRWTSVTTDSMNELIGDAGLASVANVSNIPTRLLVQIIKALLRMDQFRIVPGGSAEIRRFQRHLNLTYVVGEEITTMDLSPCDGVYSRDVQQAVMKAVQFEIGIPRADIGGYFGSTTKSKLQAQPSLGVGSEGDMVHLFTALCVFNSPVILNGEPVSAAIRREYTDNTAEFVRAFQRFSQLPVTGKSDYDTWAQLLVSTGNEFRETTALDEAAPLTFARAKALSDAGFRVVGRYLDEHLPPDDEYYLGKALTSTELSEIIRGGLRVYPIFQWNGTVRENFTEEKGLEQGNVAEQRALEFGFNRGTCIYFAVDFDATQADIDDHVIPYFRGVRAALGRSNRYTYGVYGSRNVCSQVSNRVGATWSFVSGLSWGFSGNLGFPLPPNWSFNQIRQGPFSYGSGSFGETWDIDRNVWRRNSDPGTAVLNADRSPAQGFIDLVQRLYTAALEYDAGIDPTILVCHFFRQEEYNGLEWKGAFGAVNQGWIAAAAEQGLTLDGRRYLTDPVTGTAVGTEHLMATLQACLQYPSTTDLVSLGDGGGWAGDLASFYADWRRNKDRYPNPMLFALDYLGKRNTASSFDNVDWISDADGFNIMRLMKEKSLILPQAVARYYGTDSPGADDRVCQRRYTLFQADRFDSDSATTQVLAKNLLLGENSDITVIAGKWLLAGGPSLGSDDLPENIDPVQLNNFVLAYAWELQERVDAEGGK